MDMFVHNAHLRHLLRAEDYFDPAIHSLEVDRLLRPGWHFLAAGAELPRPGDFKTIELLGVPLIARNCDGEIRAFLNVCAHRHCTLTSAERGHAATLRCQYHGWEYDKDGRTGRIPDARCFRPWDRESARLRRFPTTTLGGMTYVALDEAAPPLPEFLGDFAGRAQQWFADPYVLTDHWRQDYDGNWKIVVENSLESYHIPCLHQKSFGEMPPEATCEHDLDDRFTEFRTPEPKNWAAAAQNFLVRSIGGAPTNVYTHRCQHPNLIFIAMDVMRMAQLITPLSPTRTRHSVWVFTLKNRRRNPWAMLMRPLLSWLVVKIARQIVSEDAPIFSQVQRGLERSPFPGVVGTREERLYYFQRRLVECYGREGDLNAGAPCNGSCLANGTGEH